MTSVLYISISKKKTKLFGTMHWYFYFQQLEQDGVFVILIRRLYICYRNSSTTRRNLCVIQKRRKSLRIWPKMLQSLQIDVVINQT